MYLILQYGILEKLVTFTTLRIMVSRLPGFQIPVNQMKTVHVFSDQTTRLRIAILIKK